jgi:hypothetical protein
LFKNPPKLPALTAYERKVVFCLLLIWRMRNSVYNYLKLIIDVCDCSQRLPSRYVRRKGAAPISGAEEQTARTISAYAHYAFLLSLQIGSSYK